jgi:hypothetical protein
MAVGDEFVSGPQVLGPGGQPARASLGLKGEVTVAETRGRFYDLNYNGKIFHGTTAVAGAALATATTLAQVSVIAISNPAGSGVNAAILKAWWQYVSGELGLGGLLWAYLGAVSAGGTAGTATNGKSLLSPGGAKCTVWSGATSFSATCSPLRPSGINLCNFAGAANVIPPPVVENVDGDIICPPGFTVGLVGIGAGTGATSDKSILGISWAEEPV